MRFPPSAIKVLQTAVNSVLPRSARLAIDGRLGKKTVTAVANALADPRTAAVVTTAAASVAIPVAYLEYSREDIIEAISTYSAQMNVSPQLAIAVCEMESSFNPLAVSPTGAVGLFQFIPSTADEVARKLFGEPKDPMDPKFAIPMGVAYLATCARAAKVDPASTALADAAKIYTCYNLGIGAGPDLLRGDFTPAVRRAVQAQGGEIAAGGPAGYLQHVTKRLRSAGIT